MNNLLIEPEIKKKSGRPKGSKNKPKVVLSNSNTIKSGLYNITLKHNRSVLHEGRDYGMAFAFINKKYETVHPVSPCKDYMNDIVWAENVNKYCGIFGLSYHPTSDFLVNSKGERYDTLELCLTDSNSSDHNNKFWQYNQEHLERSLIYVNKWEDKLGVPHSQIELCPNGIFNIVRFNKKWVEEVYMISLYTLLWRIGRLYPADMDVIEYISSTKLPAEDVSICQSAIENIKKIYELGTLNINSLKPEFGSGTVHNNLGIVNIKQY